MPSADHKPGCVLDSVHWLRHAVAAAGRAANPNEHDQPFVDTKAATALTDALAHFAELDDWATVTLGDVARHSNLMAETDRFDAQCTCGLTA